MQSNKFTKYFMLNSLVRARGFSLIEIMVALALGLLLTAGILTLFSNTSRVNKAQEAVARLQENGRYALSRIVADLRMARGQYCSNSGGLAVPQTNAFQDTVREPMVYAASLALFDANAMSFAPTGWPTTAPYPLSPRFLMQGYDCDKTLCAPALPTAATPFPAIGTAVGNRTRGADVLTVRYLQSSGWSLVNSTPPGLQCTAGQNNLISAKINPIAGDPPVNFVPGDKALLADCSGSEIVAGNFAANTFTPAGNFDDTAVKCINITSDARLFNFTRDFVTVSYYLRLQTDPNPDAAGRIISSLMRRVNGVEQAIADGVERLDILYGVEDNNGATLMLNAAQLDGAATNLCPPAPVGYTTTPEAGCLWRSVKSVEVHLLLNTVNDVPLDPSDTNYRYSFDAAGATTTPGSVFTPTATMQPTGLSAGRMIRREFTALVSVRNYHP